MCVSMCNSDMSPACMFSTFQVPTPASVTITSDQQANPVNAGSTVRVTCTVKLSPAVAKSDLSEVMVDAQLSRDGTPLTVTHLTVADTIFTYTIQLDSFGWSDSGNYACTTTVRPQPHSTFLTESGEQSDTVRVTAGTCNFNLLKFGWLVQLFSVCTPWPGVYLSLGSRRYGNNSYVLITDIGKGDDGACLLYTSDAADE